MQISTKKPLNRALYYIILFTVKHSLQCKQFDFTPSQNSNDETADIIAASDWMTLSGLLEINSQGFLFIFWSKF